MTTIPTSRAAKRDVRALSRLLSLDKRVELLNTDHAQRVSARKYANAGRTIARWRTTSPFDDDATYARFLTVYGLTERKLAAVLCLSTKQLEHAYTIRPEIADALRVLRTSKCTLAEISVGTASVSPFLELVAPLIANAINSVSNRLFEIPAHEGLFDHDSLCKQVAQDLCDELQTIVLKTCLWELKLAKLSGSLVGATKQARFADFLQRLRLPSGRIRMLRKYPVLLDIVSKRIHFYETAVGLMLERVARDIREIAYTFFEQSTISALLGWKRGCGDSHNFGSSVTRLLFKGSQTVIYKPRSLHVDAGFSDFISWYNDRVGVPRLHAPAVLARNDYGWCEYIPYRGLDNLSDAHVFYERQGTFIGLFYALHASDMHCENIICHGADPVYVDLEALFHPIIHGPVQAGELSDVELPITVVDTLMVPYRRITKCTAMVDLSALTARDGQPYCGQEYALVGADTDDARLEEVMATWRVSERNQPTFAGALVKAEDYLEDIKRGFVRAYDAVVDNVGFLSSINGIQKWFGTATIRVIIRPTNTYTSIAEKSLHPDYLVDALERDVFLSRIVSRITNDDGEWQDSLVTSEVNELWYLDVPYFSRRFDSRRLSRSGGIAVDGILVPSSKGVSISHVLGMNYTDRNAQARIFDLTLSAAPVLPTQWRVTLKPGSGTSAVKFGARVTPLDAAIRIAGQLGRQRVVRGRDVYWICNSIADGVMLPSARECALYDGQLGVALFLATVGTLGSKSMYVDLALAALDTVRRWTSDAKSGFGTIGVFTGAFGFPYVLACLAQLLDNNQLLQECLAWLDHVEPDHYVDEHDVLNGAAGVILFLASLLSDPKVLQRHRAVILCHVNWMAERLAKSSTRQPVGCGWLNKSIDSHGVPLTGFAHGIAGIAASLYVAGDVLERREYFEIADEAIAYEDAHMTPTRENWLDLREFGKKPGSDDRSEAGSMCAWCHGAAGVLLGRLICLEHFVAKRGNAEALLHDVAVAQRTLRTHFTDHAMDNVSMCHGALGNAEILMSCAGERPRQSVAGSFNSWRCGDDVNSLVAAATAAPGLMNGKAGVGYGFLRYAFPETVPSVLRLEHMPWKHASRSINPVGRTLAGCQPTVSNSGRLSGELQ